MTSQITRSNLILTGLIGLMGAVVATVLSVGLVTTGLIPVLITRPILVWGIFFFLLTISIAEIPLMVFGMRRMVAGDNPKARYLVLVTNMAYTLFAGVYAVPFILLTGSSTLALVAGSLLGALTFVRLISAALFVPKDIITNEF